MISSYDYERAERLFAVLGDIDPEMQASDMKKSVYINHKAVLTAALGIAAALALIIGIFNLRSRSGLDAVSTSPTAPTANYTPIITDAPPTTQPTVSETHISDSARPDDTTPDLPTPSGEGIGGDEGAEFYYPVKRKFEGIDTCLHDIRKDVDLEKWVDSLPYDDENGLGPDESVNVYSFMKAFGITKEEAEKAYEPILDSGDDQLMTRQDLEVLFSGDEEAVARTLASEYTIVVGDRMYSPYWLYRHSVDDYIAAGIPPQEIKKREDLYDGWFYFPDDGWYYRSEDGQVYHSDDSGLDEEKAFFEKLKSYVPDIRFERLERHIAYFDITLTANGAEYDVYWLSSHNIQDYREAGITIDDLKTVLDRMSPYGMSNQYEWIEAGYQRMIEDMGGAEMPGDEPEDGTDDAVDEIADE